MPIQKIYQTITSMILKEQAFENVVVKEENPHNQHFSFFNNAFYPSNSKCSFLCPDILSSANRLVSATLFNVPIQCIGT